MRAQSPILTLHRIDLHQRAKNSINLGQYSIAEELLLKAHDKCGSHVLMLTDLATVYMLQNKMIEFSETILKLHHEFSLSDNHLSEDSFCLTAFFLGGAYEKMAAYDQAMEFYEQAHMFAHDNEELSFQAFREYERLAKSFSIKH